MNPSTKFPRSYSFLKCPPLSGKYMSRKRRLKNPSLRKKTPPTNTSQQSGPISAWIRQQLLYFRALFIFKQLRVSTFEPRLRWDK